MAGSLGVHQSLLSLELLISDAKWGRNGIDQFVLARLEQEGLKPSGPASCDVLIRRVSLDLIGLPPTVEEAAILPSSIPRRRPAGGRSPARQAGVRRALGGCGSTSPATPTRAGYADDPPRTIWKYRDYVINAFNANKPFDRFTIEQIAGDLLPEPDRRSSSSRPRSTATR